MANLTEWLTFDKLLIPNIIPTRWTLLIANNGLINTFKAENMATRSRTRYH